MTICLQLDHVNYSYGAAKIRVLSDVNADFESGKMYAITGPSGAGKSTLLSLLAGLDAPSDGVVRFEGEDIATTGYSKHRREHVSLVFQDHNLIDYLTPEENLRLVNPKADMKILEDLGLSREESKRNIMHLSGGQRQRVAVGRALVAPGRAILADEPTGSLDPEMTDEVIDLLRHAAHQLGKCVIVVTHSKRVADSADAVYTLRHKKLAKHSTLAQTTSSVGTAWIGATCTGLVDTFVADARVTLASVRYTRLFAQVLGGMRSSLCVAPFAECKCCHIAFACLYK